MRAASESNPPHIHRTKKPPPGNPAQEAGPSHQVDQPQGAGRRDNPDTFTDSSGEAAVSPFAPQSQQRFPILVNHFAQIESNGYILHGQFSTRLRIRGRRVEADTHITTDDNPSVHMDVAVSCKPRGCKVQGVQLGHGGDVWEETAAKYFSGEPACS